MSAYSADPHDFSDNSTVKLLVSLTSYAKYLRSRFLVISMSKTRKLPEAAFLGFENIFHPDSFASVLSLSKLESGITTSHLTSKVQVLSIFFGILEICFTFSVTSSHVTPFHRVMACVSMPSSYMSSIPNPSNLNSII